MPNSFFDGIPGSYGFNDFKINILKYHKDWMWKELKDCVLQMLAYFRRIWKLCLYKAMRQVLYGIAMSEVHKQGEMVIDRF